MQLRIAITAALALVLVAAAGFAAPAAHAIANPRAIDWDAPPAAFVTSLYVGVLGRSPESAAVVSGWAAGVTNAQSRLRVFHGFLNSPEYRNRYGSNATVGHYTVWIANCPRSPNSRAVVSTRMPAGSWSPRGGMWSWGYAMAYMGWYTGTTPYRACR